MRRPVPYLGRSSVDSRESGEREGGREASDDEGEDDEGEDDSGKRAGERSKPQPERQPGHLHMHTQVHPRCRSLNEAEGPGRYVWLEDDVPMGGVFAPAPTSSGHRGRRQRAPSFTSSRGRAKVPRSSMFDTADPRAAERVCDGCKGLIERVLSSEHTLRALLGNPYLDLRDLVAVRGVSKQCATAVDFLHTKWSRFGQAWFDSPGTACDAVISVMLQQNRHLLHGHPNWEVLAELCGSQGQAYDHSSGDAYRAADGPRGVSGSCTTPAASASARADPGAPGTSARADPGAGSGAHRGTAAPNQEGAVARRASCRLLRCRKTCCPAMTAGQCVWSLLRPSASTGPGTDPSIGACGGGLRERALQRLETARPPAHSVLFELVPFVPTLMWAAAGSRDILARVVVPSVAKSDEFAFLAYFCARDQAPLAAVWAAVRAGLSAAQAAEVAASEYLLAAVLQLVEAPSIKPRAVADMVLATIGPALAPHLTAARPFLPGSSRYRVVALRTATLRQVKSSTLPWAVQCSVLDVETGQTQDRTLMVKREPMWNDLVVGLVQKYLLAVDPSLELEEPYYVCPVGPSAGLLLFVPGCRTLHEIEQGGSILKWLSDSSPAKSCAEVQQTFMRSCATTSILSRLMGFGDRHLQNILCTGATGRLVHVDFAYLWSQEPAVSRHRIMMPEQTMRITPGMLQVFDAHYYDDFLALCTKINRTVRSAAVDLHYVCWALVSAGSVPETVVCAHFNSFMLPYAKNGRDADAAIVSVIQHETETRPRPLVNLFRMLLRYVE